MCVRAFWLRPLSQKMKILLAPFAAPQPYSKRPNAKNYPFTAKLVCLLEGHDLMQIGGSHDPQIVPVFKQNPSHKETESLLQQCDTFIAVDSYLQHAAWAIGKPGIVLWGPSDPLIFGHDLHTNLFKSRIYLRPNQFLNWEDVSLRSEAFVDPEVVVKHLTSR